MTIVFKISENLKPKVIEYYKDNENKLAHFKKANQKYESIINEKQKELDNKNDQLLEIKKLIVDTDYNLIKEKYRKAKIIYDISDFENDTINCVNMYENDRELIFDVEQKVKGLKDIDIKIVNLFYYSSISIKDIAKKLNISELNVKTRLHRIRKKIKKELDNGGI